MARLRIRAYREPWNGNICLSAHLQREKNFSAATPLVFTEREHGSATEPFLIVTEKDIQERHDNPLQELANSLWECGIRPAQAKQGVGALAATRHHLEDMRQLVLKKLYRPIGKEGT